MVIRALESEKKETSSKNTVISITTRKNVFVQTSAHTFKCSPSERQDRTPNLARVLLVACVMTRLGKLSYPVTLLANDVAFSKFSRFSIHTIHTHTDTPALV